MKANSNLDEGIGSLKAIAQVNITNNEIVEKAGDIIWKCISLNDGIDQELAKMFADILGHETVIEILLSKEKGPSSKPYIKIINGLVQIPQLIQKLIDSGLIETVKLVNDLYCDDFDAISINFDTLKKISNLKVGRDIILKKNFIPNILKNIKIISAYKKPDVIITGLQILDNLSRSDEGKQSLKENEAIENISTILDSFQNNDYVLRMGAKIYSKISTTQDIINLIQHLKEIQFKEDYSDLRELQKALVLISNFMLVDEICGVLSEPENLQVIKKIFATISNLDLKNHTKEYLENYILLNKYFMIIFHRLFNIIPEFFEDEEIKANINKSILNNYKAVSEIKKQNFIEGDTKSFCLAFSEYFSSFADLFEKKYQNKNPEETFALDILNIIKNESSFLEEERPNYSASRILKISNRLKTESIKKAFEDLFDFFITTVKNSENVETLTNIFDILFEFFFNKYRNAQIKSVSIEKNGILKINGALLDEDKNRLINEYNNKRDLLMDVVLKFMNEKPKYREPNLFTMKILSIAVNDAIFMDKFYKMKNTNFLFDPIISVMAKHIYETSNIFEIVSLESSGNIEENKNVLSEELENEISNVGVKILEKLIDQMELLKIIKNLKDSIQAFDPAKVLPQNIEQLETSLLFIFCILKVKLFFNTDLSGIIDSLRNIIKKEVAFIEAYKKEQSGKSQEEEKYIKDNIKASSKRILLQIGIIKLILDNCIKNYQEVKSANANNQENTINPNTNRYLDFINELVKVYLEFFEKSNDNDNILMFLDHLSKNSAFLLLNEEELNTKSIYEGKKPTKALGNAEKKNSNNFNNNGVLLKNNQSNSNNRLDEGIIEKITNNLINLLRKNVDCNRIGDIICSLFIKFSKKNLFICDILVKSGCPRLLLEIIENSSNSQLAKKALELLKMIMTSSDENLTMISNQNVFEKIFEISTKFQSDEKIKNLCDLITSQLIKLPNQEGVINNLIENAIQEIKAAANSLDFNENFENYRNQILNNLEKINAFSSDNKINSKILEKEFIENCLIIVKKENADKEISDTNEKLLFNLLSVFKLIQSGKAFKNKEENKPLYNAYLDHLLDTVKTKSHYRDLFINGLRSLCKIIYNKDNYEKFLANKIEDDFIDSLFVSNENYLEDAPVLREINNTLCGLCINSETLAKYIVTKGGLANILEELRLIVKQDDPTSENIKYSGLKFIDSLVKENSNMDKFIQLKGGDLVLKFLKRFMTQDDEQNQNTNKRDIILSDYLTNTTIMLYNDKSKEYLNEKSLNYNLMTRNSSQFINSILDEVTSNYREWDNSDLATSSTNKREDISKRTSVFSEILGFSSEANSERIQSSNKSFYKKTSNLFTPMIIKKSKTKAKFSPYLVYLIKIIDTNIKQGRNDFNNPKLFKNILSLIKNNFPNLSLFNKAIEFLSDLFTINKDLEMKNKEKRKLIQIMLSNFARYHNCEEIVKNSIPLLIGIQYEDPNLKELIKVAITCNELQEKVNNLENSSEESSQSDTTLLKSANNPEIKAKFLSYLSLYLENDINMNLIKSKPEEENELKNLILTYFNGIIKQLTDVENYDNIGFTHDQGFGLALLKIRKYLEKNKLLILKDDYYTEKIFNACSKFFGPENFNYTNRLINDFNHLYDNLYNIRKSKENINQTSDSGYYIDNNIFTENEKIEFLEDFYSFNNLIAEGIFSFYEFLINQTSNFADSISDESLETISKLTGLLVNYSECKNENNAIKLNYIEKIASYAMTFLLNQRLNEERITNNSVKKLLTKFWELLNNLIKIDENNSILSNDDLINSLANKLNVEIPLDPNNETLRSIYNLFSKKLDNNIDLFEKIIEFAKKEILDYDPNVFTSIEVEKRKSKEINFSCLDKKITFSPEEQSLFNFNCDLELLSNISKFNITSRLLMKNEDLINLLKSLFNNFEDEFSKLKNYQLLKPNINNILEKTKDLLFNVLFALLANKSNRDEILNKHSDILKKIITDLKSNNLSELGRDNLNSQTFINQAKILADFVTENFSELAEEGLKILDIDSLTHIQDNISSDKNLSEQYSHLLKKLTILDKDKQIADNLEKIKLEISDICKKVEEFYKEHNEEISAYQLQQMALENKETLEESQLNTMQRFTTMNNNTMANISTGAVKKLSIISRNILFSIKDIKFRSPLSAKDNEEIEKIIEKIINHIIKLYSENKTDANQKRISERNPLISRLLNSLKYLSVSPNNHILIFELGLINFMEKLLYDKENLNNNIFIYLETLDIAKNCTASEASIPVFISSSVAENIISDIFDIYDKPEVITNNLDMRHKFKYANRIFSNLCTNKRGFNFVFDKLGMNRLIEIAMKTYNEFILEAVLEMILNYIQNNDKATINKIINEIFFIIIKAFKVYDKNRECVDLLIKTLLVLGNIAGDESSEKISEYDLPNILNRYDLGHLFKNLVFFNALLFCISRIAINNIQISKKIFECGLFKKIKDHIVEHITNLTLMDNLTKLILSLLKNNIAISQKFLEGDHCISLFMILEKTLLNSDNNNISISNNNPDNPDPTAKKLTENDEMLANSIIFNVISCFNCLTINDKAISYLAQTKFNQIILQTIAVKLNEPEIIKVCLNALANYLYSEIGSNIKTLNLEKMIENLSSIQTKYYFNSDILISINTIAGYLIKCVKEMKDKENLFRLICVGIKAQDWNGILVISTLNLILDIFDKNKILQENFFSEIFPNLINILKIHLAAGNADVLLAAYKLVCAFAKVYFNSLEMVNEGIYNYIKDTFEYIQTVESKGQIHIDLNDILFKILELFIIDLNSKKRASEIFIGKFLLDLKNEDPQNLSPSAFKIVSFMFNMFEIKDRRHEFVQYNGVEVLLNILKANIRNMPLIKTSFMLFSRLINNEDEIKRLLKQLKVLDLINEVSQTAVAKSDKEYSFISAALISDINDIRKLLEKVDDCIIPENSMKIYNNPIKPEIKNFLTSGRVIRLIDENGSKQSVLLVMTNDLLKIMAKKLNSNVLSKDKYIIDVCTIKKISRGYANDSFKKSVGFFSNMFSLYPEPNRCFSIFSNTNMSNTKVFNVKCATEDECFKWITYLKTIIDHLTKTRAIINKIEFDMK